MENWQVNKGRIINILIDTDFEKLLRKQGRNNGASLKNWRFLKEKKVKLKRHSTKHGITYFITSNTIQKV